MSNPAASAKFRMMAGGAALVAGAFFVSWYFGSARIWRIPASTCDGTFKNTANALGEADVSDDGSVSDFNEQNAAVSQGSRSDIACGGFTVPKVPLVSARLLFSLGMRRTKAQPAELPQAGDEQEAPSDQQSVTGDQQGDGDQNVTTTSVIAGPQDEAVLLQEGRDSTPLPTSPREGEGTEAEVSSQGGEGTEAGISPQEGEEAELETPYQGEEAAPEATPQPSPSASVENFGETPSASVENFGETPSTDILEALFSLQDEITASSVESVEGEVISATSEPMPSETSEPATSNQQQVTSDPQQVTGDQQEVTSDSQPVIGDQQSETDNQSPADAEIASPTVEADSSTENAAVSPVSIPSPSHDASFEFIETAVTLRYRIGGGAWKTLQTLVAPGEATWLAYDLPSQLTSSDLELLEASVRVDSVQESGIEVFLDSIMVEIDEEEVPVREEPFMLEAERADFKSDEKPAFRLLRRRAEVGSLSWVLDRLGALPSLPIESDINAVLVDPDGKEVGAAVVVRALGEGLVIELDAGASRQLRPGRWRAKLTFQAGGEAYEVSQDFSWGVLAINPNAALYKIGQHARIDMAVLDDRGRVICDADVELDIIDPAGGVTTKTIPNGGIIADADCADRSFTVKPDYTASYAAGSMPGTYRLVFKAFTANGMRQIRDAFVVEADPLFEVFRSGPTRIYPIKAYAMTLSVTPQRDFAGTVREVVPSSFMIEAASGGVNPSRALPTPDGLALYWDVSWKAGHAYTLAYAFDAPDRSPEFYALGPLALTSTTSTTNDLYDQRSTSDPNDGCKGCKGGESSVIFAEQRKWQIAADSLHNMILFYTGSIIPTDWTCISCASGDPFFQRLIMASSTEGVVGGTASSNHTVSFVSSNAAGAVSARSGAVAIAADLHAHNSLQTSTSTATSNLPFHGNIRLIRYDGAVGDPTTLPAGVIAMFESTVAVPSGWTVMNGYDQQFLRGESVTTTALGSNSHVHRVTFTTGGPSGTASIESLSTVFPSSAHTHSDDGTGQTDTATHVPPFIEAVLARLVSATTVLPIGMYAMWDDVPDAFWDVRSDAEGEDFSNRMIRASSTTAFPNVSDAIGHAHADAVINTTIESATVANGRSRVGGAKDPGSPANHTHQITVSLGATGSYRPPFRTVIVAKRTANPASPAAFSQDDFIFENDSASSANANTAPAGAGQNRVNVERGERFVVRFLLTNTGGTPSTTVFSVQYDRNDNNWKSVTSGEIALQYGISGTSVSALTTRKTAASCSGGGSFNSEGRWYENTATSQNYALGGNACTELAWIFSTATAGEGVTYRLRLYNQSANKPLDASYATPTLAIVANSQARFSKTGTAEGEIFSPPSDSRDLTYWLDATGYSAVASSNDVYDTATAFEETSVPISLFKIKNANLDPAQVITLTWEGQSNAAASGKNIILDLWDTVGQAWLTASTNNFSAADTDFTFQTVTSGSWLFDANNFIYARIRQAAGIEALRTDRVASTFADQNPILAQRAFLLENDNTLSPDANTSMMSASTTVEKGQRFIVRFQVDNTGNAPTTTKFHVQFDRNDGNWRSATSGEIALARALSGQNGDALSTAKSGSCNFTNGTFHEETATTANFQVPRDRCTEFAFAFSTATATVGGTYRFRLVNGGSNGAALAGYMATPTITIVSERTRVFSKQADTDALPADSSDLGYYLDATGYGALAQDDGVFDYATSTSPHVPGFVFKIKNPNGNNTDEVRPSWQGQSSVSGDVNNIFFDIWNNALTEWVTVTTNASVAADTAVTLETATAGNAFYDANNFIYLRAWQAGGTQTFRTDSAGAVFAEARPILTQRAYRLENDDGGALNDNSERVSATFEKGERFIVRFQLDNTGTAATTTQYEVQYDRGDDSWMSVTSGEISVQLGINGSDGDALASPRIGACVYPNAYVNGAWYEARAMSDAVTLGTRDCTELAWALSTATASENMTYRLRLYNRTANTSIGSSATPTVTIVAAQNRKHSKTGAGAEAALLPTDAADLAYYFDDRGYDNNATDNGVYDTATSTGGNMPIMLFKTRNPNLIDTDQVTIAWNGQSNVAPSTRPIILDIWHNGLSAWITATSNNTAGANADFSLSTVTSGGAFFDASYFVYTRLRQAAGAEALKTDRLSMTFGQPVVTLAQRAFVLENDNGATPDANTSMMSASTTVEKGQRFIVRFQLEQTGNVATTAAFRVQYDRNDNNWRSVTSGEISAAYGISGASQDALSVQQTGSCEGGLSFENGRWHEDTATSSAFIIPFSTCTELAWIFSTATATVNTTYRFRLFNESVSRALDGYMATPTITIVPTQERKHSKTGLGRELAAAPLNTDDLSYYLDATGYAAVAADDGDYDSATSSGGNVPVSVFKIKNAANDPTDVATITWNGKSSVAPSTNAVELDIWHSGLAAWLTIASNAIAGAEEEFTLSGVTSSSAFYDANNFIYVRVRQAAGAEALHTDHITATFADPAAVLTQRAAIFENDNGSTPDTNTQTASGSPALSVQKGQRIAVRFQVDNSGNITTTTQFQLQFDRSDNTWGTVTAGEIAAGSGISGAHGDALTSAKANGASCAAGSTFRNGAWHEQTATSIPALLENARCTEIAFMVSTATAVPGTTYRFRLVNGSSGASPIASVATPTITIAAHTKTYSKTGAGGELFSAPTDADDLPYYLDATGYAAVLANDGVYDAATSTVGNVPVAIFKIKNPNDNNTDQAAIEWNGKSSAAPSARMVTLEMWHESSLMWLTLASNASAAADTDFTLLSVTSGPSLYDVNNFMYVRVRQEAGAEALQTDQISAIFTEAAPALTQRAAIFENDNGSTPDTNTLTASGSPALSVQKGQRIAVRFQVDNTGTAVTTTKFQIQFDRSDGAWGTVTSGEIGASFGISGSDADSLSLARVNGAACAAGLGFTNGSWHENTATSTSRTIGISQCTEIAFMISTATATEGATYRFRLINGASASALASVATPTLTIAAFTKIFSKTGPGMELAVASSDAADAAYYLDATGYAAVLANDGVYDAATSTVGNVPVAIFKIKNPNENTTDDIALSWTGQSNVAPSTNPVFFDIWHTTQTAWITVTTNNFSAADADFSFTSVTNSPAFFDASFFIYIRVRQAAGAEGLKTDAVTATFTPPPTRMIVFWDREDIPADWTCISCNPGDDFYQRFPVASSTYGLFGGSATHTHVVAWNASTQSGGQSANAGAVTPAANAHTHDTLTATSVSVTSNLPLHGHLRLIRHDITGDPDMLATGTIAMFKSSGLPQGWSLINTYDNQFIRGESVTTSNIGADTHAHAVSVTSGPPSGTGASNSQTASAPSDTHTHAGSGATAATDHKPPFIEMVLARLGSATSVVPNGILVMWEDVPASHWSVASGQGGDFENRYLRANASTVFPATGGATTHTPPNLDILTGVESAVITNARIQGATARMADVNHTHTVTVSFETSGNVRPPYATVIVAEKLRDADAALRMRAAVFENDDGATVDANTTASAGSFVTEKGQRFVARFQIENTGGPTTTRFAVQYDRGDNDWRSVTSGEISMQSGLSGSDGDALSAPKANDGACGAGLSFASGRWHEAATETGAFALIKNRCTEFGFMLSTATATEGVTYRLRLANIGNASLPVIAVATPTVTIVSPAAKTYSRTGAGFEPSDPDIAADDLGYFFDAAGYGAVETEDGSFESATATVGGAEPHFIFKARADSNTMTPLIDWRGQVSDASARVVLQAYKYRASASLTFSGSATGWITFATSTPPGAGTTFTATAAVAGIGVRESDFYAADPAVSTGASFIAVRVVGAGGPVGLAVRTDRFAIAFTTSSIALADIPGGVSEATGDGHVARQVFDRDLINDVASSARLFAFRGEYPGFVGEFGSKTATTNIGFRLADRASGRWLEIQLQSATSVTSSVAGAVVTVAAENNATGSRFTVADDRVKADWRLNASPASNTLQFSLAHNFYQSDENDNSPIMVEDGGDVVLRDTNGLEVFRLPEPVITDAAGSVTSGSYTYNTALGRLALTIPQAFLDSAVYPVTVDPTTIVSAVADSMFHAGARKLVTDRHGNLVLVARPAANTLRAYYSNDGGASWTAGPMLSTAVAAGGYGASYDGATSVVHVAYATTGGVLRYNQLVIGYDAQSDISSLTSNDIDPGTGGVINAVQATIIAASGTNAYVPIIIYGRDTSGGNKNSGLWYKTCATGGSAGACRTAANWPAAAGTAICNTGKASSQLYGISAAQSRPSNAVRVFFGTSVIGPNSACATTGGGAEPRALSVAIGAFSGTETWTFGNVLQQDASQPANPRQRYLSALEDTAWSTTNSRVLVTYARNTASPFEYVSRVFNDDGTNTSSAVVIDSDAASANNVSGQAQCSVDTTPQATSSKRFVCALTDDASGSVNNRIRIAVLPLVHSGATWNFTTVLDASVDNAYPMQKVSSALSYDPYGLWRGWRSTTSYVAVKASLGVGPKFDLAYTQGTTLVAHTWHLDETLFATSTVLLAGLSPTATNPAFSLFAAEADYASVTSSNNSYMSVTTGGVAAFPSLTLRKINPRGYQTDIIGVHWEGQSTHTATAVRLQIFKFKGADAGWYDLAAASAASANTDFTLSATASADFPVSGASLADYYGSDPTGGIAATATSMAMVRVYQGALANQTLRTDVLRVTFSEAPSPAALFQEDFIFENDSASSVNENSVPVSSGQARIDVAKGERFVVRFLLNNAGQSPTTTIFQVQFDRNDNAWQPVTSGEISVQFGISGKSNDVLTAKKTATTCSGGSIFNNTGRWYENSASSASYVLDQSACTELAFIFSTASATEGATYRLRLFNHLANKALDGSTATPTLTIANPAEKRFSKTGTADGEIFSIPSDSADLTYYLDATGYSAVASSDNIYDTATSFQETSIPSSLFKIKNPNLDPTQAVTLTWEGQSNMDGATKNIFLELWNNDSQAWLTVSTNAFTAADTDFTFQTVTSGASLYDTQNNIYARVRQAAGQEALRTDRIIAAFAEAAPVLTQRSSIFENDNGSTVDTNTIATSNNLIAEKGQRFIARFQVDNTGTAATTTRYRVQFDRGDNNWRSVTSGEIAIQYGISGQTGDALSVQKAGDCAIPTGFTNGAFYENMATSTDRTLATRNCTEMAWIFSTATATVGTTYRLRLWNETAERALDAYAATPTIIMVNTQTKKYSKTGPVHGEVAAPSANTDDLVFYLDATGYSAVAASDNAYDTATSLQASGIPTALFKVRNANQTDSDNISIQWEGHSNVAPSANPISLEIWDNIQIAWLTVTTNNFSAADTDFTLSTVTSGAAFFDANFFAYVRVRQAAGVEALRTDRLAVSFTGAAFTPRTQNWRWYDDETNETPSAPFVGENIAPSNIAYDNNIKLRVTVRETANTASSNIKFRLQFSEYSDFSTSIQFVAATSVCAGNSLWCYADGAGADNAIITTRVLSDADACAGGAGDGCGTHNETATAASAFMHNAGAATEYEFTLRHDGARANTAYFFRLFDVLSATGVALNTGESYPSLSTEGAQFSFSISGLDANIITEGITTDATTTPTSVPFGTLPVGSQIEAAQRLTVSTNATQGYQIYVLQREHLSHADGAIISQVTGTNEAPAAWSIPGGFGGAWGYHAGDDALAGGSTRFAPNDTYARFTTSSKEIAFSSIPVANDATDIVYKIEITDAQEGGFYESSVVYIAVPVF